MKGISDYAVVYDITSDKERGKVDKVLKGFGFRIQKSVFECRMNKRTKEELIENLDKLDVQTGFVKVYRLEYSSKNVIIGKKEGNDIDEGHAYIV
ncbi:MAG: CRISPR-associated endonuclease Cas2 [Deltaproteobacteria bacterium]|nr:CRISPR-associated endonuclease Cas2 [Deltaproteobacteria bacterium]